MDTTQTVVLALPDGRCFQYRHTRAQKPITKTSNIIRCVHHDLYADQVGISNLPETRDLEPWVYAVPVNKNLGDNQKKYIKHVRVLPPLSRYTFVKTG